MQLLGWLICSHWFETQAWNLTNKQMNYISCEICFYGNTSPNWNKFSILPVWSLWHFKKIVYLKRKFDVLRNDILLHCLWCPVRYNSWTKTFWHTAILNVKLTWEAFLIFKKYTILLMHKYWILISEWRYFHMRCIYFVNFQQKFYDSFHLVLQVLLL